MNGSTRKLIESVSATARLPSKGAVHVLPATVLLGFGLALFGCETSQTPEMNAPEKIVPTSPTPEYDTPLAKALFERWRSTASETEGDGEVQQGTLAEGESKDFSVVLTGIYCYKVLAVGSEGLADIDLVLFDESNVALLRDRETDGAASLGINEPICPFDPGTYRLRIRATKGSGQYALRLYRASSI